MIFETFEDNARWKGATKTSQAFEGGRLLGRMNNTQIRMSRPDYFSQGYANSTHPPPTWKLLRLPALRGQRSLPRTQQKMLKLLLSGCCLTDNVRPTSVQCWCSSGLSTGTDGAIMPKNIELILAVMTGWREIQGQKDKWEGSNRGGTRNPGEEKMNKRDKEGKHHYVCVWSRRVKSRWWAILVGQEWPFWRWLQDVWLKIVGWGEDDYFEDVGWVSRFGIHFRILDFNHVMHGKG